MQSIAKTVAFCACSCLTSASFCAGKTNESSIRSPTSLASSSVGGITSRAAAGGGGEGGRRR